MANIQELVPFNKACEELIASKYILVDMKFSSIINSIDKDNKLRDIVSDCCEVEDYSSLIKLSCMQGSGYSKFVLPTDEKAVVCIVYNLLYQFANKDISFYDFLNEYYAELTTGDAFEVFCRSVIVPFSQAINSIYNRRYVIVDSTEYQENYYNKIKSVIKAVFDNIDSYKLKPIQKDELTTLLNSLYIASENSDKKSVFALMIGIDYFTKVNKKARPIFASLETCFSK